MDWAKSIRIGMRLKVFYVGTHVRTVTVVKRLPSGRWRLSDKSMMSENGHCRCSVYHCPIRYEPIGSKPAA